MPSKSSLWPPAKKDISGLRLKRLLDKLKEQMPILDHVLPVGGLDLSVLQKNESFRGLFLDFLLNLYLEREPAIAAAFSVTSLNPKNAIHWAELFKALCEAHFGDRGAGRDAREPHEFFLLAHRVAEIRQIRKIKKYGEIADVLKQKFKDDYKQDRDTLRKLIPKAEAFVKKAMTGPYPGNPVVNMLADEAVKDQRPLGIHQVAVANLTMLMLENKKNSGSGK